MENKEIINGIRAFHYILGSLNNQQNDPLCKGCLSFAKPLEIIRERFMKLEAGYRLERQAVPEEISELMGRIYRLLDSLSLPESPVGQKKAGNCRLPEGVCFPKYALAFLEKLEG